MRNPQREALGDTPTQIVDRKPISSFFAVLPRAADQCRKLTISVAMRRQHYDLDAFGQQEFGADDEVNAALFRFHDVP